MMCNMKDTKKSIIENVKKELDKIESGIFDRYCLKLSDK